jgi:hypothetical protein
MDIEVGKIMPGKARLEAIKAWPTPKNKKQLQRFLGLMNYYRRFIKGFSEIARPMHNLVGKADWEWKEEQQKAFEELKERFTGDEILHMPMDKGKFILEVDASNYATGALLSQLQEDKKNLIDTDSKAMNEAERNYPIYDKEMLAVMRGVKKWRHLLLGAKEPFEIMTDHQNLTYYRQPQNLTRRQAQWAAILSEYDFKMKHVKGNANGKADALSRRDDHNQGEDDNKDVKMLQDAWFNATSIEQNDIYDKIAEAMKNFSTVEQCAKELGEELKEQRDGTKTFREMTYMPKNKKLRDEIIELHHDQPMMGHAGPEGTKEKIQRGFWWPKMMDDITKYCHACDKCQRTKADRTRRHAPLRPNLIPDRPWQIISWDLIGPLPESNGYNAIFVAVDRFSKRAIVQECNTMITSEGVARIFRDRVF